MPTCVAYGCSSRADKGELLKIFPRKDLRRRQIWIDRVNRPGWVPTKYSALCEFHFDHNQWELPREDGKRKLKNNAVPTVFCVEHPSVNDVVAKDHAYCMKGYRQLYDNKDTQEKADYDKIIPIEHIKLERDENFNPEIEECESNNVEEEQDENIEDIQCTPDISVYPEHGEPDPIEMVDCEEDGVSVLTSEPSQDPLAISDDDVMQVKAVEPHFVHSKKFVFVTKDTKYMIPPDPLQVKGEPVIGSEPPRLKVLNPRDLFGIDSVILQSPAMRPPTLAPASVPSPVRLKVLPPESLMKPESVAFSSTTNVQVISSPNISSQSNLNLNCQKLSEWNNGLSSHPNLNTINERNKMLPVKRDLSVAKFKTMNSDPVLKPAPEYLRPAKVVVNDSLEKGDILISQEYSHHNTESVVPNQTNDRIICIKDTEKHKNKEKDIFIINSMEHFSKLENIFLEHQYVKKSLWKPGTINGIKLDKDLPEKGMLKLIGNNEVKMWLNSKKPSIDSKSNRVVKAVSKYRKIVPNFSLKSGGILIPNMKRIPTIKSSSIVVLKPFEKGPHSTSTYSLPVNNNFKFYQCSVCTFSFLSLAALQSHLSTHEESSSSKCLKESDCVSKGKTCEWDSDTHSLTGGVFLRRDKLEDQSEWKIKGNSASKIREKITKKRRQTNMTPQEFHNGMVSISNLDAIMSLKGRKLRPMKLSKFSTIIKSKSKKKLKKTLNKFQCSLSQVKNHSLLNANRMNSKLDSLVKGDTDVKKTSQDLKKKEISIKSALRSKNKSVDLKLTEGINQFSNKKQLVTHIMKNNPIVLIPRLDLSVISSCKVTESCKASMKKDKEPESITNVVVTGSIEKECHKEVNCKQSEELPSGSSINNSKILNIKVKCPLCSLMVKKDMLENHSLLHSSCDYKCSLCNKTFSKSFQLRRHVNCDHKVVKSFKCPRRYCGQMFETKRQLEKHTRTHKK